MSYKTRCKIQILISSVSMQLLYLFLCFGTWLWQGSLQEKIKHRIINGEEVSIKDYPYQVRLILTHYDNKTFDCGGVLISKKHVLTASHCLSLKVKEIQVLIGVTLLNNSYLLPEEKSQTCSKCWVNHPYDDMSIITLPLEVEFSTNAQPISLPKKSDSIQDFLNKTAEVSGWGLSEPGVDPNILRAINVTITTSKLCPENALCSVPIDDKTACYGDSGGPVVMEKKVVGIVSGLRRPPVKNKEPYPNCKKSFVTCYTNVRSHLEWIHKITGIALED